MNFQIERLYQRKMTTVLRHVTVKLHSWDEDNCQDFQRETRTCTKDLESIGITLLARDPRLSKILVNDCSVC